MSSNNNNNNNNSNNNSNKGPNNNNRRRRGGRNRRGGRGRNKNKNATTNENDANVDDDDNMNEDDNEEELEEETQQQEEKDKKPSMTQSTKEWLQESLTVLGHYDPSSVLESIEVTSKGKEAEEEESDKQLVTLTLWLEDRLIRLWELPQREKLRSAYWTHINEYLEVLECPKHYMTAEDDATTSWRYSSFHRIRIIYWMIACATSEHYNDQFILNAGDAKEDEEQEQPPPPPTKPAPSLDPKSQEILQKLPLGFTTGDDKVDDRLKILRLQLLMQLEKDQKQINQDISMLQQTTVMEAKPLKSKKQMRGGAFGEERNLDGKPKEQGPRGRGGGGGRGGGRGGGGRGGGRGVGGIGGGGRGRGGGGRRR